MRTHTHKTLSRRKSQSAMEYLMSYGWAILIIAVVLGVLVQLGVFSGSALAPKAQPGSCQVQRLLGQVSLEGLCQGQLPEYVGQFDGSSGYISLPTSELPLSAASRTISIWVYQNNLAARHYAFGYQCAGTNGAINLGLNIFTAGDFGEDVIGTGVMPPTAASLSADTWYNLVMSFSVNTNAFTFYKNGVSLGTAVDSYGTFSTGSPISNAFIGAGTNGCLSNFVPGMIADVQVYNVSLSANEVQALYIEGIGGAPVKLQNIVGWWPLNGNANDYSGNNYNGQIHGGVSFNSTWNSQYTPP